jgi:hypothetical protein
MLGLPLIKRENPIFILGSSLPTNCESTSEMFALKGHWLYLSHALCLEGHLWMVFADFGWEFLQLGFYLMVSWMK